MEYKFKVGDKVEHTLSGDWVLILDVIEDSGKPMYECRNKKLDMVYLYEFEVKQIVKR